MKKDYKTIDVVQEHDESTPLQESSDLPSRKRNVVVYAAICVAFLLALTTSFKAGKASASTSEMRSPLKSQASVRDCTKNECLNAGCNNELDPFHCKDNNGCSANPWGKYCRDSCDLSNCDEYPIDTSNTCEGVQCDRAWCRGRQKCGNSVPYQCLAGSARFGCTSDPYGWTEESPANLCSDCCDARTCS